MDCTLARRQATWEPTAYFSRPDIRSVPRYRRKLVYQGVDGADVGFLLELQFLFLEEAETRADGFAGRTKVAPFNLPLDEDGILIAEGNGRVFGHGSCRQAQVYFYPSAFLPFANAITRSI